LAAIVSQIVEVCVFKMAQSKPRFLLLKRAANEELYPNIWQIVTGTIKEKESTLNAALRELDEEAGLSVKRCWTVPYVDSYFDTSKDAVQLAPVFAVEVDGVDKLKLSSEHQDFKWLTHREAKNKLVWHGQRQALDIVQEFIVGRKDAARLLEIKQ
jgi:dihydroneopterin triphosphate diphosphatase